MVRIRPVRRGSGVAVGIACEDAVLRTRWLLPELVFLAEPIDGVG